MTLATHVIIAGAVTKPLAHFHPAISFFVALASHYLSDMIPHWNYNIRGVDSNDPSNTHLVSAQTLLRRDVPRTLFDLFLGSAILFLMLMPHTPKEILRFALIAIGAVLPDALQGVYYFLKHLGHERYLAPVQRFHDAMHTKINLDAYPRFGIPFQLAIFLIFLLSI